MRVLERFSLCGKTALVTGAAGLYGRQIARGLAEAGARTYIASRHLEPLVDLANSLRAEGHDVRPHPLDQADEASILALRDTIAQESERLDVLVNNAGITRDNLAMRMKDEEWDAVIETNLSSVFSLSYNLINSIPVTGRQLQAPIDPAFDTPVRTAGGYTVPSDWLDLQRVSCGAGCELVRVSIKQAPPGQVCSTDALTGRLMLPGLSDLACLPIPSFTHSAIRESGGGCN